MTLNIRRIVTGHDEDGNAIISSDYVMDNIHNLRSGNPQTLLWQTEDTPANVDGDEDPAYQTLEIEPPERGSIFRILELQPKKDPYMHRTCRLRSRWCQSDACKGLSLVGVPKCEK